MEKAGLEVRVDAVGNTYGLWEGSDPSVGPWTLVFCVYPLSPSHTALKHPYLAMPELPVPEMQLEIKSGCPQLQKDLPTPLESGDEEELVDEARRNKRAMRLTFVAGRVMTGSHADSIIYGGVYDGALGVIGAIAAVAGLKAEGFQPERSIEVVQFTSEEGDRFTEVCFGRSVTSDKE